MPIRDNLILDLAAVQFDTRFNHAVKSPVPYGYGTDFTPEEFWAAVQKHDDLFVQLVETLDMDLILRRAAQKVAVVDWTERAEVLTGELSSAAFQLITEHPDFEFWRDEKFGWPLRNAFTSYRIDLEATRRSTMLQTLRMDPFDFSPQDIREALLTTDSVSTDWTLNRVSPQKRNAVQATLWRFHCRMDEIEIPLSKAQQMEQMLAQLEEQA